MKKISTLKTTINLLVTKGLYNFYAVLTDLTSGHQYFAKKKIKIGSILIAATLATCASPKVANKGDSSSKINTQKIKTMPSNVLCYEVISVPVDTSDKLKESNPISADSVLSVEPMCYTPPVISEIVERDSVNNQPKNPN